MTAADTCALEANPHLIPTIEPAMSVVVITIDNFATVRRTLEALAGQDRAKDLEIVLVLPRDNPDLDNELLSAFHSYQIITCKPMKNRGFGIAAGMRAAHGAIVACVEDHSFAQPGWAAALIKAHAGPYAAAGPVIINSNPRYNVSWADIITGYGNYLAPQAGGEVPSLAGHNCSYKRDILLKEFGSELEQLLDAEIIIHERMRNRGLRLYLEPNACVAHLNFEKLSSWLRAQFLHGRLHGGLRAENWTPAQRIRMVISVPLVPFVRTLRLYRKPALTSVVRRVWPTLLIGHLVGAIGEAIGCIAGVGDAANRLCPLEFHRERHFRSRTDATAGTGASGAIYSI